jgi:hypothetical protein
VKLPPGFKSLNKILSLVYEAVVVFGTLTEKFIPCLFLLLLDADVGVQE